MAVDHVSNKHGAGHPIVTLDLASDEAVEYLLTLLSHPQPVFYIHAARHLQSSSQQADAL